jgi:hypothetical protein
LASGIEGRFVEHAQLCRPDLDRPLEILRGHTNVARTDPIPLNCVS